MPIESSQYFIILFRVNQVFTFYHFIESMYYYFERRFRIMPNDARIVVYNVYQKFADVIYQRSEHQKFQKSTSFWATMLGEH